MGHLDGKVAIVTGGVGGMGSWVSRTFAEQGAKVVVADTGADVEGRSEPDASRIEALVAEIQAAGGEAVAGVADVSNMEQAEGLVQLALDTYGDLDILCCVHGILRERMIFNMGADDWDDVVRVHLKGCFTLTKFASIHWRANRDKGGRRIIYFTSSAGIRGEGGQPNYSAAHAGKIGLSLSNSEALGRYGVTSNCISPGASTRMTDRGRTVDRESEAPSLSAAGTRMDPRNVIPAVVYLASDASEEVTGRVVGATGNKITMWKEPEWVSSIYSETPYWDIDELFKVMPETLVSTGVGPPPRQFP
jgi:NAD(P)-dependent dehydrogenase (short-subunit alcohol dehydrogenase family)